jgi:hypothetical protein
MKMLMEMDLDTEVELSPVAKAEAAMCNPYSSPSTAVLLKRRVVAWCVCLSFSFHRVFFVCRVIRLISSLMQGYEDWFTGDGPRPRWT